jgi:site-specific DNA-methyltransferase (adenine-specific)
MNVDRVRTTQLTGTVSPIYDHDGIVLYNADAFAFLPAIADDYQAVVTDPPYGTGWTSGGVDARGSGTRSKDHTASSIATYEKPEWDVWNTSWIHIVDAYKPVAIFCPDRVLHTLAAIRPTYRLRYYVKTMARPAWRGLDSVTVEPIFISPGPRYSKEACHLIADNGSRGAGKSKLHPCQKPVNVLSWILRGCCHPDHTVLDPFAGSGTTLLAARDMGRRAIGIERDEKYCKIIVQRLSQRPLFV